MKLPGLSFPLHIALPHLRRRMKLPGISLPLCFKLLLLRQWFIPMWLLYLLCFKSLFDTKTPLIECLSAQCPWSTPIFMNFSCSSTIYLSLARVTAVPKMVPLAPDAIAELFDRVSSANWNSLDGTKGTEMLTPTETKRRYSKRVFASYPRRLSGGRRKIVDAACTTIAQSKDQGRQFCSHNNLAV